MSQRRSIPTVFFSPAEDKLKGSDDVIISLYGNDETEFSKKLNFVKPQLIAFARASHELRKKTIPDWNLKRCLDSQPVAPH